MQKNQAATLYFFLIYSFSLFLITLGNDNTKEIYDKIYSTYVVDAKACVRYLNQTAPIGCSTGKKGVYGNLFLVDSDTSLNELKKTSTDQIAVLKYDYFNYATISELCHGGRVKGFIALLSNDLNNLQSPLEKYPNIKYSLHPNSNFVWNTKGTSWLYYNIDCPIFSVYTNNDTQTLIELANKNKESSWPLYAAELTTYMWSNTDTETCLRRGQCEPIGGTSIWATFGHSENEKKKSIIALSWLDSLAFFQDLSPGADATISGLVAMLAGLQSLSQVDFSIFEKEIIVGLLNGENWGFLGSTRFVNDIFNSKDSDYSLNQIDSILELRQIGLKIKDPKLYTHTEDKNGKSDSSNIISAVQKAFNNIQFNSNLELSTNVSIETDGIPPSSTMAFLKSDSSLPAVVLTDHFGAYSNNFYGTSFDDSNNIDNSIICDVATVFAQSLFLLATKSDTEIPKNLIADCALVDQMIDCLLNDYNCELFKKYLPNLRGTLPSPPTNYASIVGQQSIPVSFVTQFMRDISSINRNETANCTQNSDCFEFENVTCVAGVCLNSTTQLFNSISLGLKKENKDWQIIDSNYPTWTESVWASPKIRLFLVNNPTFDLIIFLVGSFELVISFFVVFKLATFFNQKFNIKN
eukprot:TRINITY_DN1424_c0_g5_i1.p1 TRINITY_DN1424_c0_g5~~TRINITY_DN1424_c0_g5_i1.p1  ORF type:complete len:636 (+),score=279.16 TRINITY_DN1424_c0_g5_i1:73-1980(+)